MKTIAKGKTHLKVKFEDGKAAAAATGARHGRATKTLAFTAAGAVVFGAGATAAYAANFVRNIVS